jgi:hypothetical protein
MPIGFSCTYHEPGQTEPCPVCNYKPVAIEKCPECKGSGLGACLQCACLSCIDGTGQPTGQVYSSRTEGFVTCPACHGSKRGVPCKDPKPCVRSPCRPCMGSGRKQDGGSNQRPATMVR